MNRRMPYSLFVLIMLIACCCVRQANAQPYYFKHYQVESGLSNNTVFCSIQDKSGFLWFGTKEGLNRFDGYRFKLFMLDEEGQKLQRDFIYCLCNDPQGTLWVGTQKGLYWFDALHEKLVHIMDSLPEINSLQADRTGHLWFISGQTVGRYTIQTHTVKLFAANRYFNASTLCMSEEGDMWFATTDGYLQQFNARTETFNKYSLFSFSGAMSSCSIKKLYPAGKQQLFIGTSCQGLKLFAIATHTCTDMLTYNADRTTVYVRDILQYS